MIVNSKQASVIEFSLEELAEVSKHILSSLDLSRNQILSFEGDLGAGKTTLIKELIKQLGVDEVVKSPSYAIQCEYQGCIDGGLLEIQHWDLYRISEEESDEMLAEFLSDKGRVVKILFIEWGERLSQFYEYLTRIKIGDFVSSGSIESENSMRKASEMRKIQIISAEKQFFS